MSETEQDTVSPQRVVELSKLYLEVALNRALGSDETRRAASDTVHALAELEQLRSGDGTTQSRGNDVYGEGA